MHLPAWVRRPVLPSALLGVRVATVSWRQTLRRHRRRTRILVYVLRPAGSFLHGWLTSRVVSVLDSGAEGSEFKSQPRRCRVTVLGKLFAPIAPLFTKQQNL